jgi:DNA-directed RNA polymerase specialized sigma24 family protein
MHNDDWETLRPRLERMARQRLGDDELAREVVQEAVALGWEKREALRNPRRSQAGWRGWC